MSKYKTIHLSNCKAEHAAISHRYFFPQKVAEYAILLEFVSF
jgi:hypothetical protein